MGDKDQKTEEPTGHKISEERKRGNVYQSQDIAIVVMLLGAFILLRIWMPTMYKQIMGFLRWTLDTIHHGEVNPINRVLGYRFIVAALICALPLLLGSAILGVLSHGVQTRFNRSMEPLRFKLSKLNPANGIKRIFSLRNLVSVLKNIIKIALLLILVWNIVKDDLVPISRMMDMAPMASMLYLMQMIWDLVIRVCIGFTVIAAFDFWYERREYHQNLRMTKQEVKDEYKMMEGNPEVKNKMKQRHREMTNRRMMQNVPTAAVIVRNPTHVAVALKYDTSVRPAPYVVAKGVDYVALKIVDIGEQNGVNWIENKELARALYAQCEIGQEIPQELYGAVAEILVQIYRLKGEEEKLTG